MDQPNWDDLHTPDEWADLLDTYADEAAHKRGNYQMYGDLIYAAQCIRDLVEQRDALIVERDGLKLAGAKLVKQVLSGVGVEALEP